MTIDQLSFDNYSSSTSSIPTILTIDSSQQTTDNVGIGMYPSLMGTFNISKPILAINSAPSGVSSPFSPVSFHTMYLDELWTFPSLSNLDEETILAIVEMSLSAAHAAYQVVLDLTMDIDPFHPWTEEEDLFALLGWVVESSCSHDWLNDTFHLDEAILGAMTGPKQPWEEMHYRSYFLPELE